MLSSRSRKSVLRFPSCGAAFFCAMLLALPVGAETGTEAWLRYPPLTPQAARNYRRLPHQTVMLSDSLVLRTAKQELSRGVAEMLGSTLHVGVPSSRERSII